MQNKNNHREEDTTATVVLEHGRRLDHWEDQMQQLEVLYFSNNDSYGWIYRDEFYFEINHISNEEKVLAASILFEKKVLNWFQC